MRIRRDRDHHTPRSEGEGLGFNYWGMVLYPILLRAICIAATPTDAEQIITDYRSTCGLIALRRVLASAPYVISANDSPRSSRPQRTSATKYVTLSYTTSRPTEHRQRTGTTP